MAVVNFPWALDPALWRDGTSRVWGATWRTAEANDPRLPGAVWGMEVRIGSKTVRLASAPLKLRDATGASRIYAVGLSEEIEITDAYEPGSSSGPRSVSVAIPNRMVDALAQIQAGFFLSGTAELFLAIDGQAYEDRLVVMDGDLTGGVAFGVTSSSMIRTTLSDPQQAGLPLTPYVIELDRFSAAATSAYGARFPYVFSEAYSVAAPIVSYPASPGTGVTYALACVPGNGLEVTGVSVNGVEKDPADVSYAWESIITLDDAGGQYLGVKFTGTAVWSGDESITVDVTGGADRYLHQCVRALLDGFTTLGRRRTHYELLGEIVQSLGSVTASLYVNGSGAGTAATAISAIESTLTESFPMLSMVTTDGRYGPVVTDARMPVRGSLTLGIELLSREGEIEESDKDELRNGFTLLYNYDHETDSYNSVATRSPGNSVLCSRSAEMLGERYADPVEAAEITSDSVAGYVVDWLVYHRTMPSYTVEYQLPLAVLLRHRLGWNVELTDAQLGLSAVVATVVRRRLRRGVATIGLRIYWPSLSGMGSGGAAGGSPGSGAGGAN